MNLIALIKKLPSLVSFFSGWQIYAIGAAAVVVACGAFYADGRIKQHSADALKAKADLVDAVEDARRKEQQYDKDTRKAQDDYEARIQSIASERDDALQQLRNRPERLPEPARAACEGSTGAELSRPDAELLTRLAAEADALRAKLAEWEAWGDTVTNKR